MKSYCIIIEIVQTCFISTYKYDKRENMFSVQEESRVRERVILMFLSTNDIYENIENWFWLPGLEM